MQERERERERTRTHECTTLFIKLSNDVDDADDADFVYVDVANKSAAT